MMSRTSPSSGRVRPIAAATLAGLLGTLGFTAAAPAQAATKATVLVRALPGQEAVAETSARAAGATVGRHLGVLNGFVAEVPGGAATLAGAPGVAAATPNATVQLLGSQAAGVSSDYSPSTDDYSLYNLETITGVKGFWRNGFTGQGIDVALIDSGTVPVDGLTGGKVVNGPDLSFESQGRLRNLDTFGHGTHMAGIIAGRDSAAQAGSYANDGTNFLGVAPDARLVSLKVADAHGSTDVTQVIAAIDWVVQHAHDPGMNIRVINLSYGTDGAQSWTLDPLAYAAEQAWKAGIVVVAAAGNSGRSTGRLNNPAANPYVIAVGAADPNGTPQTNYWSIPSFTSSGNSDRDPDISAPGVHVVSLRAPGSYIDTNYGAAGAAGDRFFRGSGSSQATAFVSGAAALLLSQRPQLSPDQVKLMLNNSGGPLSPQSGQADQAGRVGLRLRNVTVPSSTAAAQNFGTSTGTGTLDGARGSAVLELNGVRLTGDRDIFGRAVRTADWARAAAAGTAWNGGTFNGTTWAGNGWSGGSWTAGTWTSNTWAGGSWTGGSWTSGSWTGGSWTGGTWTSGTWTGGSWTGGTWTGGTWTSDIWS